MDEVKRYVPWQTPEDNDIRMQEWLDRLIARGIKPTIVTKKGTVKGVKPTKSGIALKYVLDLADAAERAGLVPASEPERAQA